MGNQFLSHIRTTSAIVQVVRAFHDDDVQHVNNEVLPRKDIEIINTELVLADLQTVEKRISKFEKEARANPKLKPVLETMQQAKALLNEGKLLSGSDLDLAYLADLQLITAKPIIYLFNVDEATLVNEGQKEELIKLVAPATALFICAKLESELTALDQSDAQELLESYGQQESGLVQLIHAAYRVLGLQSYLTAGEKRGSSLDHKKRLYSPPSCWSHPYRFRTWIHRSTSCRLFRPACRRFRNRSTVSR